MADFYKNMKEARWEIRAGDGCNLDIVSANLDEMEQAWESLDAKHDDLIATLRQLHCVECNHEDYRHQGWDTTSRGYEENGDDPKKRYCDTCGSEIVDGKCSWKPDEEAAG